jgi:hypothetical protein
MLICHLTDIGCIVKPDTILKWFRELVAKKTRAGITIESRALRNLGYELVRDRRPRFPSGPYGEILGVQLCAREPS